MKTLPILLITLCCCGLVSCEKARDLLSRVAKKPQTAATPHSGALVTEIQEGGYDSFRLQSGKVAVVDFYADWCGPCRKLGPILEQIANEHGGKIVIGKVNVDQHRSLASSERVRGIPDVRIFRNGREVDRFVGLPAQSEVRRRLEVHLTGLEAPATGTEQPAASQPSTRPMSKDWLPPGMQRR